MACESENVVVPAVQAQSAALTQNYRVMRGWLGAHPVNTVLPGWYIADGNDLDEMVRRRKVEPVNAPVVVPLTRPRKAVGGNDGAAMMLDELNALRAECEELKSRDKSMTLHLAHADQRVEDFKKQILSYVEEHSRLRIAVTELTESRAVIAAELDTVRGERDKFALDLQSSIADVNRLTLEKQEVERAAANARRGPGRPPKKPGDEIPATTPDPTTV